MKATRQHKTSSRKNGVVSPSTTDETSVAEVQSTDAELDGEATQEATSTSVDESSSSPQLGLVACPGCGQTSLFWNRHDCVYRCVNPECKSKFTLEEYKNSEEQRLLEKAQSEQILAIVSATEEMDNQEPANAEEIPSSEPTTPAISEAQPAATEESPIQALDYKESVVVEETKSQIPTIEVKVEEQPLAIECMPSGVSAAQVKEETIGGAIESSPSAKPGTKAEAVVEEEAKAGKQINRNLAFLLIGVLVIGVIVLGVFLGQKSSNLDDLSSQLGEAKAALTASQMQLNASQQDLKELRNRLVQSQQELAALQAEINALKPMTPSKPFIYSGELSGGEPVSIPIELKLSEKVEGTITGGLGGLTVYIQDPGGRVAKDLGRVFRSSFTFTAATSGTYTMIIAVPAASNSSYVVNFTIYSRY